MEKYVKQIIKACGKEADYIVVLKMDKTMEAMEKLKNELKEAMDFGGLYIKGKFNGTELNIFRTGKILVRGIESEEDLKRILNKIFS
jgi:TATA-box binding protein (TBP) (component of TFIID and TFIIIB)